MYWKLYHKGVRQPVVSLGLFCYWKIYHGSIKRGVLFAAHFLYWKVLLNFYWNIYHAKIRKVGIFLYWKLYHYYCVVSGNIKKYGILAHVYVKYRFRKDLVKQISLFYFGIDKSQLPVKLPLKRKPRYYLPVASGCKSSCSYCPSLHTKISEVTWPNEFDLKALGFSGVTLPCNFMSLGFTERESVYRKYSQLGHEVLINPDFINEFNAFDDMVDEFILKGKTILVLVRPTETFQKIYKNLKETKVEFYLLYVFDISGDSKILFSYIDKEDWHRVEFLNTSKKSPEVTDEKNFKFAPKLGKAIKSFCQEPSEYWPSTSAIHFPFLVSPNSLAAEWLLGLESWGSPYYQSHKNKNTQITFSIIIPVRHQIDHACKVLINLTNQEYAKEKFELIFVDDGNEIDLSQSIQKAFQEIGEPDLQIRVIRYPRETKNGFDNSYRAGQARNMGMRFARGEKFLFVDSDILVAPTIFKELELDLKDDMIIQFPRYMLTQDATEKFSGYQNIVKERDTYSQSSYWEEFKCADNWEDLYNYWKYTCTYGLSISRKTIQKLGPFRSDYIFYGFEDVDLGYRLFQIDGRFKLHKSPVYHLFPDEKHSFHFDADKRFQALSRSASIFFHKNMDLNFYFDLKGFLVRPWQETLKKPFYVLRYHWQKKREQALSGSHH
ncbi:MAG: glycosyltransferase [Bdellovibrionales bacterium]|nr:glycosyltransferase [Bdellovibrionales bacterium]